MFKIDDGIVTCRGINLTDSDGNVVMELRGDDHNSGVWVENLKTGHLLCLSANDHYTGIGVYGKDRKAASVAMGLRADGTVILARGEGQPSQ